MTNPSLRGLGTALVTPFLPSGEVDFNALSRLVDRQLTAGVDYLVVLGTTGEAVTLTDEERRQVRRFIVRHVAGRVPLVLGVGGNCTAAVVAQLQALREELKESFAAILSVCPYYNKPNQEGLFQHFTAVAEASPVPVILYNVPGRTGVNMLPETVVRIWNQNPEKVLGIKEASGNLEQIQHLISLVQDGLGLFALVQQPFLVISGDDGIAVEMMRMGAAGLISVASNAWPAEVGRMLRERNTEMQERFAPMVQLLFREGNPTGIKAVLSQMGLASNALRLPLVPATAELESDIARELSLL